jgi:hypothetical protein
MRVRKRPVVIPAHPRQRRRVISRRILRPVTAVATPSATYTRRPTAHTPGFLTINHTRREQRLSSQRSANPDRDTIQKIAPRNRAPHAQFPILLFFSHRPTQRRELTAASFYD